MNATNTLEHSTARQMLVVEELPLADQTTCTGTPDEFCGQEASVRLTSGKNHVTLCHHHWLVLQATIFDWFQG